MLKIYANVTVSLAAIGVRITISFREMKVEQQSEVENSFFLSLFLLFAKIFHSIVFHILLFLSLFLSFYWHSIVAKSVCKRCMHGCAPYANRKPNKYAEVELSSWRQQNDVAENWRKSKQRLMTMRGGTEWNQLIDILFVKVFSAKNIFFLFQYFHLNRF